MPRMAASNYNSQPGRVHVLTGKAKREFGEALLREHTAAGASTFSPFPDPMPPDCAARVGEFGQRYYAALGIDRTDKAARYRQTGRNFVSSTRPLGAHEA